MTRLGLSFLFGALLVTALVFAQSDERPAPAAEPATDTVQGSGWCQL